jgi:hypothetical protein
MLTMNENLYPDGGWWYRDAEGTKHKASSFRLLVKLIIEYRQRRAQDVGNPTLEVMTQLCGRNRGFCRDTNGPGPIPESPNGNLMSKVLNFMSWLKQEKRLGHVRLIDRNVALARAHICARCPRQRGLPTTCGSCAASVATSRKGILDGQDPVHAGIAVCSALEEDVCTAVHLAVPQRQDASLPAECWRRNC